MSKSYHRTKGEFEDNWEVLHIDEARRLGYIPYFSGCAIHREGWMIQNAINDILLNGRDKYCVVRMPGSIVEIWIIPNYHENHPNPYLLLFPED